VPLSFAFVSLDVMQKTPKSRGESDNEILTLGMLAGYLHCHPSTIYRLARQGKIPHFRLGGGFRFKKAAIDEWIASGGGTQ
jgi:excisionase family DNA binding protein